MNKQAQHTSGPWDYVPSTEHHGPYVTSEFGTTVCDFYVMTQPSLFSTANGGKSRPIHHLHEMADANARLTAAAPEMLEALHRVLNHPLVRLTGDVEPLIVAAISKATGGVA